MKNNSFVVLGTHFERFVQSRVATGKYKNANDVILAGLRLLEDEESHILELRVAIQQGIESGIAEDFDPKKHLENLKSGKTANG